MTLKFQTDTFLCKKEIQNKITGIGEVTMTNRHYFQLELWQLSLKKTL